MIEENRFRAFLIEPPCTSFSPAAHPAVRSYREPLGFDRLNPKTLHGNILAFRSLVLLRVGRRHRRPCGLEQSRLSKMAWLSAWISLRSQGFEEAVIASCRFQSIHRKEFRFLCYLLDTEFLDRRCLGGHTHVKVEGAYTKPSAVYTDGLALHIASAFRLALRRLTAEELLAPEVSGHETILSNDVMLSSKWEVVRAWFWKRQGHINVLELSSTVSNLVSVSESESSVRFCSLVDSAVCKGALSKGRSSARALQPLLKRTCAVCVARDLYPGWIYTPTRLNCADDPTRDQVLRSPLGHALSVFRAPLDVLRALSLFGLRRFASNWVRLVLLVIFPTGCDASLFGEQHQVSVGSCLLCDRSLLWTSCGFCPLPWTFQLSTQWIFPSAFLLVGLVLSVLCLNLFGRAVSGPRAVGCNRVPPKLYSKGGPPIRFFTRCLCAMVLCWSPGSCMPLAPTSAADRTRAATRAGNHLVCTRAVRQQTIEKRKIYLDGFRTWLLSEKGVSLRELIESKPPDPERIADFLIDYGRELYIAGRAYGIFAETINAVAVERPLIRRQLTAAWDLAFVWLSDEPRQHHPAMPISVMVALVAVALCWGWAHEAAVILLGWTGILRIGEVLAATRRELVLPVDAVPGTTFALLIIRQPKTRGRAARHQAARIDQADVIAYLTAMYGSSDPTTKIWPFSASTLRKRFGLLLTALKLPTKKLPGIAPFDLGSLRPGGATWLLHQLENPDILRRRGRWASWRTMDIYIQEVQVATFAEKLEPETRDLIRLYAGGYASLIERCTAFLNTGIPATVWFYLLKAAGDLGQTAGKDGGDGEFQPSANNYRAEA